MPHASCHIQYLSAQLNAWQKKVREKIGHSKGRTVPPLLPPHVLDAGKPPLAEQQSVGPQLLDAHAIGAADGANFGLPPEVSRGFMRTEFER